MDLGKDSSHRDQRAPSSDVSHLIQSLERFSQVTKLLALSHCLCVGPNDGDSQEMTRNVDVAMEYAAACEAAASNLTHKDELRQYVQTAEAVKLFRELGIDAIEDPLDEDAVTSKLKQLLAICDSAQAWLCTSIVENPCLSLTIFEHLYNKVKGDNDDRAAEAEADSTSKTTRRIRLDAAIANRSKAAREFRAVCHLCCKQSGSKKAAMTVSPAKGLSPQSSLGLDETNAAREDAATVDILDIKAQAAVTLVRPVASQAKMNQVLDIIDKNISHQDARALTAKLKTSISLSTCCASVEGSIAKQAQRERLGRSIRLRQREKKIRAR